MSTTGDFPSPDTVFPVLLRGGAPHKGTVFLNAAIDHPRMEIGDFTYASAHHPPEDWAFHLAPYLYEFSPERLILGKFCQIADGALFVTASANHRFDGFSSFPFTVFGGGPWTGPSMPPAGPDTVIGHDVWIGARATILPGARIGSGCIIGAGAVVGGEIPPFSIVAGNPGRVVRARFDPATIERLMALAWWEWPIDSVLAAEAAICGADIDLLETLRPG